MPVPPGAHAELLDRCARRVQRALLLFRMYGAMATSSRSSWSARAARSRRPANDCRLGVATRAGTAAATHVGTTQAGGAGRTWQPTPLRRACSTWRSRSTRRSCGETPCPGVPAVARGSRRRGPDATAWLRRRWHSSTLAPAGIPQRTCCRWRSASGWCRNGQAPRVTSRSIASSSSTV